MKNPLLNLNRLVLGTSVSQSLIVFFSLGSAVTNVFYLDFFAGNWMLHLTEQREMVERRIAGEYHCGVPEV